MSEGASSVMAAIWRFLLLYFALNINSYVWCEKQPDTLNVLSILLPYSTAGSANVNFTVWASEGCYKWSSSRPEIAQVRPILKTLNEGGEDACSQQAVVTSQSTSGEKQTAIIIAEEKVTGYVLRCDVFVNRINRIEITTTTRELLLGQSPELLDIQAYDDTGNLFSSLDGLVFDWELITVPGSIDASSVLRIVPFAESINETSVAIYELEAKGLRGHSIIVEGINTGTAVVQAKLRHSTFKDVKPADVTLLVIDNLMIMPSMDVYIMINTAVKYAVKRFRQNSVIDIDMPSAQFKFTLSNTTVGTLDEASSQVIGRSVGYTQVTLLDQNMLDSAFQSTRQPVAGVHVVQPDHLGFTIHPDAKWILETNHLYTITVDIYDKQNHKIFVAENLVIEATFPDEYFSVSHSSQNGSYHIARTLKSGKTLLKAILKSVKLIMTGEVVDLDPAITGQQHVTIYDPIHMAPAIIVFPWIPESTGHYKYQLEATGGSGTYTWTSDVDTIATVNTRGLLTTTADTGLTKVKAHDTKNMKHFGLTLVYVLPPEKLKFISSKVEVEVGSKLKLPLAVAAYLTPESSDMTFFDDCRKMNFTVTVTDSSIFQVLGTSEGSDSIIPPSCTSVYVKALRPGYVVLTARYKYKNINIKASTTIAAYLPLKPLDPTDIAVVSLGSAKNLILQGGPQPWVNDRSTHFEHVQPEQEHSISIRTDVIPDHPFVDKRSLHFYHVTCKELGEQNLVVTIGNKPCESNLYPAQSNTTIRFACMLPATLALEPDVHLPELTDHQLSLQDCLSPNKEFHVRSPQDLKLRMILRDSRNRLFDNFTSLDISWMSDNYDMASFDVNTGVVMMYSEDHFTVHNTVKSISYQLCHLKKKQGSVTVKAAVTKYRKEILQKAGVKSRETLNALSASIRLSLTSDIRVEPTEASIFNHPSNQVDLNIYGGSGHFLVRGSDDDIAHVTTAKSVIRVTPKTSGVITVTVYDQCLDSPDPATANIRIADIDSILVNVVDKVELGHVINCTVMVLDELNKPLLVSSLELLNLTPRFSKDLLNIKPSTNKATLDKAFYTLRGTAIGNTILTFTATPPQRPQITSDPKPIQVFPPLRLDPRYIVLIAGATFQLRATGGPYPQATTSFTIKNHTVASVDSVGLITALVPGKSTVTGAVEASDPQSGHTIVFSKDHVIVEVLRLTGVKIFTPSTNLVTETEIGLRAVGLNDESPFSFANAVPGVEFHWSSSNIDVCKLKSVYDKSGITIDNEKAFRVVLCCYQPGEVVIKLQAVFTGTTHKQVTEHADLYDDVRIQVYEKFKLIYPPNGQLLLPNEVNVRIRTNRDGGKLSYSLMDVCPQTGTRPLLTVDNRGHVQTGMASGTAGIVVTSREDFGVNQTLVVHVEVKSVGSISISPQTIVHTLSHKLHAFPVGMSALFSVYLHDNVGRKFDSSNVPLRHRLNRLDSIHISQGPDNGTYSIRAHNDGDAIFNVWLVSSPHIADYVHLRATHAIIPYRSSYFVGDMICFKETVEGDENNGLWWPSKGNVLSVSPQTGISIATSSGNALIYYNASNLLPTYIEVKVSPVQEITIQDHGGAVISGSPGPNVNGTYAIDVRFGKLRERLPGCSNSVLQGVPPAQHLLFPFSCKLSFDNDYGVPVNELFEVKPGYEYGKSACFLLPKKLSHSDAKFLSTVKGRLSLAVDLRDPGRGTELVSDVARLSYTPMFYVSQKDVEFNTTVKEIQIEIHGTSEQLNTIKVVSHSSLFTVTGRDHPEPTVQYLVISLVHHPVPSFHAVMVELKSTLTTQVEQIAVSFTSGIANSPSSPPSTRSCSGPDCSTKSRDDYNYSYILIILVTILLIVLLMLLCKRPPSPRTRLPPHDQHQSPYLDKTRKPVDSFVGSPYPYSSDVSPSRRRQSPMLSRRTTPGSSPRGLFSVTQ